jgi:hypothetical protein
MAHNDTPLDEPLAELMPKQSPYSWWSAVISTAVGGIVGYVCVQFRPYFSDGVHYETIVGGLAILVLNLIWLRYVYTNRQKYYAWIYAVNTLLLWGAFGIGWLLGYEHYFEDLMVLALYCGIGGVVIGNSLLYVTRSRLR